MRSKQAAVIRFPGVNCEAETARALRGLGLETDIVLWNSGEDLLGRYGGFVLPGGFSYQDRVRAGAIASRERVLGRLAEAGAAGLPILGICNGAQILVEAGLVPGLAPDAVEAALAPNRMPHRTGYHCDWVYLVHSGRGSFLARLLGEGETFPVPVAHAEGRFVSAREGLFEELLARGQIPLRYATPDGAPAAEPPHCPNGSALGAAALSNPAGNVVAMMPHPERAAYLHHVPDGLPCAWGARKARLAAGEGRLHDPGPGRAVLAAFAAAVREGPK
jgi:phosphoribosylformylglycinamidine synthase